MATKQTQSTRSESAKKAAPAGATQSGPAEITTLDGVGRDQAKGASAAVSDAPGAELRRPTKASLLQQRLACPEGTSLAALMQATGWQAHTVRAALTRLRQAGHAVERSRSDEGGTVYRICQPRLRAEQEPAPAGEPSGEGSASRSSERGVRLRAASGEASETASTDRSTDPDEAPAS